MAGVAWTAAEADDSNAPLPVTRSAILKGDLYYVEGRVRIPKGVEITIRKGTKLVGKGGVGVIEVAGGLHIQGIVKDEVPLENVTIELQPVFGELHVEMAKFREDSGGIVTAADQPASGRIIVKDVEFQNKATIDVTLQAGYVEFTRTDVGAKVSVKAVDPPGSTGNSVTMVVEGGNNWGRYFSGMSVEGVNDVTLKTSEFLGDAVTLVNCGATVIDGNYFHCKRVELTQQVRGLFSKTKFQRCDLQDVKIVLTSPAADSVPETLKIDNCWFEGATTASAAKQKYVDDHETTSTSGVLAQLFRVAPNALQLGGQVKR